MSQQQNFHFGAGAQQSSLQSSPGSNSAGSNSGGHAGEFSPLVFAPGFNNQFNQHQNQNAGGNTGGNHANFMGQSGNPSNFGGQQQPQQGQQQQNSMGNTPNFGRPLSSNFRSNYGQINGGSTSPMQQNQQNNQQNHGMNNNMNNNNNPVHSGNSPFHHSNASSHHSNHSNSQISQNSQQKFGITSPLLNSPFNNKLGSLVGQVGNNSSGTLFSSPHFQSDNIVVTSPITSSISTAANTFGGFNSASKTQKRDPGYCAAPPQRSQLHNNINMQHHRKQSPADISPSNSVNRTGLLNRSSDISMGDGATGTANNRNSDVSMGGGSRSSKNVHFGSTQTHQIAGRTGIGTSTHLAAGNSSHMTQQQNHYHHHQVGGSSSSTSTVHNTVHNLSDPRAQYQNSSEERHQQGHNRPVHMGNTSMGTALGGTPGGGSYAVNSASSGSPTMMGSVTSPLGYNAGDGFMGILLLY